MSQAKQPPTDSYWRLFALSDRSSIARLGALTLHATHDPKETTKRARDAFLARFEQQVDPDNTLPEAERQRRAMYARKLFFARLGRLSAKSRHRKAAAKRGQSGGQQ